MNGVAEKTNSKKNYMHYMSSLTWGEHSRHSPMAKSMAGLHPLPLESNSKHSVTVAAPVKSDLGKRETDRQTGLKRAGIDRDRDT